MYQGNSENYWFSCVRLTIQSDFSYYATFDDLEFIQFLKLKRNPSIFFYELGSIITMLYIYIYVIITFNQNNFGGQFFFMEKSITQICLKLNGN